MSSRRSVEELVQQAVEDFQRREPRSSVMKTPTDVSAPQETSLFLQQYEDQIGQLLMIWVTLLMVASMSFVAILNQRIQRRDDTISELSTRINHELLYLKQGVNTEEIRNRMILEEKQKQLRLQEAEEKISNLENQLQSKESEISQLKARHKSENEKLHGKSSKFETEIIGLQETIAQKNKERELLMNTLNAKDLKIVELQKELDAVQDVNRELQRENGSHLRLIEELKEEKEQNLQLMEAKDAEGLKSQQSLEEQLKIHEAQSQKIGVLNIQLGDQKAR